MILIDSREPPALRNKLISACSQLSIPHMTAQYKSGDILLDTPRGFVAIERKTLPDWWNSFVKKRIQAQMDRLPSQCDRPYLLLEGYPHWSLGGRMLVGGHTETACSFAVLHSFIDSTQGAGIRIAWTGGMDETITWVLGLYKRFQKDGVEIKEMLLPRRSPSIARPDLAALMCVPNIGEKAAALLLSRVGSIADIINSTDKDLLSIPGIGPVALSSIRLVLGKGGDTWTSSSNSETQSGGGSGRAKRSSRSLSSAASKL